MKAARSLAELLDFLLPCACIACGARLASGRPAPGRRLQGSRLVCAPCLSRLRAPPAPRCVRCDYPAGTGDRPGRPCLECLEWPDALQLARCAVAMRPPADAVVHGLKYEGWRELAPVTASFMMRRLIPDFHRLEGHRVVHVPTSRTRRRQRGYDQAEVLAGALAEAAGLRHVPGLVRPRHRRTQVLLHRRQRMENVRGAFRARPGSQVALRGASVLLVDDVLTTGATAWAATSALTAVGVRRVALVTFARALPR